MSESLDELEQTKLVVTHHELDNLKRLKIQYYFSGIDKVILL